MFCFFIIVSEQNKYPSGKNQQSVFRVYPHNPSSTEGEVEEKKNIIFSIQLRFLENNMER